MIIIAALVFLIMGIYFLVASVKFFSHKSKLFGILFSILFIMSIIGLIYTIHMNNIDDSDFKLSSTIYLDEFSNNTYLIHIDDINYVYKVLEGNVKIISTNELIQVEIGYINPKETAFMEIYKLKGPVKLITKYIFYIPENNILKF